MSLFKQPWFLIFLMLMGVYSFASIFGTGKVSFSVGEVQAAVEESGKKRSKKDIKLKEVFEASPVDTLKIQIFEAANITLKTTKKEKISILLEGEGRRYLKSGEKLSDWLTVRLSNGILKLRPAIDGKSSGFSSLFKGSDDLELTIFYPQSQKFSEVEILTISGDIEMQGTFSKDIRLKSVSGDIEFKKVNCKNLTVESVTSDLDLSSIYAANVDIKTVSGDADITSLTELPSYNFKSVSGDLNLKLPKTAQVDVSFESLTGELTNQFAKKSQTAGSIEVSSMSGSAQITKIK